MNFGQAIEMMKSGKRVARAGWNGKGMWIAIQPANSDANMLAFIYMSTVQGQHVPWLASQTDMLSEDWALA